MDDMFRHLLGKGVVAHLDDLLVYFTDMESHAKLLDEGVQIM